MEFIQAEKNKNPGMTWQFSALDNMCRTMIICGTRIFDEEANIELMKNGLKKLLVYYPHLTGRVKDKNNVVYTNEGVLFDVGEEKNLTIKDIQNIKNPRKHFSPNISARAILQGKQSPTNIKITELKDGHVLSIQCSHACMDGESFYRMVENRGKICRDENIAIPTLDQSVIRDQKVITKEETSAKALNHGWKKLGISALGKLIWAAVLGRTKRRSGPIYFSSDELNKIKKDISEKNNLSCSTHVALSAYLTKKSIEYIGLTADTKCSQVTVINVRERVANIPTTFTGNASIAVATKEFSASTSTQDIAKIIQETLAPKLSRPSQELTELFEININTMRQKLPLVPFNVIGMNIKHPTTFYINNFSKLPIYEVDFGGGKPVQVIPHDLGDQIVIRPASPERGGVEVYFAGTLTKAIKKQKQ